jgi:tartrate dehydrogenase/decarboxylase/D-malate dehydrogenase
VSEQGNEKKFGISVIPGDGIGNEVVPEGLRVLEAVGKKYGFDYGFEHYDWNCERYAKKGAMMPEDGLEQLSGCDSIFLGAVGFPGVQIIFLSGVC